MTNLADFNKHFKSSTPNKLVKAVLYGSFTFLLLFAGCLSQPLNQQETNPTIFEPNFTAEIKADCRFSMSQFGGDPFILCSFTNPNDEIRSKCFQLYIVENGRTIVGKDEVCTKSMYNREQYEERIPMPTLSPSPACESFGVSAKSINCGDVVYSLDLK